MHYQSAVIIEVVKRLVGTKSTPLTMAIVKHYLMDNEYTHKDIRQEVLNEVSKALGKNWSLTTVRRGNPALLKDVEGLAPKVPPVELKDNTVETRLAFGPDGDCNMLASSWSMKHLNSSPSEQTAQTTQATPLQESNMNTANAATKLTRTSSQAEILAEVKADKKIIKGLVADFHKLVENDKTRAKIVSKWLKSNKDRQKEWEAFSDLMGDSLKDEDTMLIVFIRLAKNPKKELSSLEKVIKAKVGDSKAISLPDIGGTMAICAVLGGGVNMFLNGITPGAVVGTVVAAGVSYGLGSQMGSAEEEDGMTRPAAVILGGVLGYGGAALGRMAEVHVVKQYAEWFGDATDGDVSEGVSVVIHNHPAANEAGQSNLKSLGLI